MLSAALLPTGICPQTFAPAPAPNVAASGVGPDVTTMSSGCGIVDRQRSVVFHTGGNTAACSKATWLLVADALQTVSSNLEDCFIRVSSISHTRKVAS